MGNWPRTQHQYRERLEFSRLHFWTKDKLKLLLAVLIFYPPLQLKFWHSFVAFTNKFLEIQVGQCKWVKQVSSHQIILEIALKPGNTMNYLTIGPFHSFVSSIWIDELFYVVQEHSKAPNKVMKGFVRRVLNTLLTPRLDIVQSYILITPANFLPDTKNTFDLVPDRPFHNFWASKSARIISELHKCRRSPDLKYLGRCLRCAGSGVDTINDPSNLPSSQTTNTGKLAPQPWSRKHCNPLVLWKHTLEALTGRQPGR